MVVDTLDRIQSCDEGARGNDAGKSGAVDRGDDEWGFYLYLFEYHHAVVLSYVSL